jgi:hydroxymethylbilane synthase
MKHQFRLGTRGSELALIQSRIVAGRLRQLGHSVEIVAILTEGDRRSPDTLPGDGMFTSRLEQALLEDEIDLAVHSAKDLPLVERKGLMIVAYPERADPRDALLTAGGGATLDSLPAGTTVGTDSPRRGAFACCQRPDLEIVPLHGNVDTRLRRLDQGRVGALILAVAGLDRLGRSPRIDCWLDPSLVPPAPGQGALAVQARATDHQMVDLVRSLDDQAVRLAVETERLVLVELGGNCRSPVGALAQVTSGRLQLLAGVAGVEGQRVLSFEDEASPAGAVRLAAAAGSALRPYLEVAIPLGG